MDLNYDLFLMPLMRFFIKTCVLRTTCYKNDLGIMTSTFGGIVDSFNNHHLSKEPCQKKKEHATSVTTPK